jgi:hypothetical protein
LVCFGLMGFGGVPRGVGFLFGWFWFDFPFLWVFFFFLKREKKRT